ncbi:uncharacterized protein ARMOST_04289 [Armillaria ostoyae]|uniref:Uncharacterized protein n=1 Tax=Armillaria ostoyae TaxID=47428 RepID=A0A284QWZ2_ARMOS|nr:uncharacterized protein ARMOST_04289 [Armillaria ostoyae]
MRVRVSNHTLCPLSLSAFVRTIWYSTSPRYLNHALTESFAFTTPADGMQDCGSPTRRRTEQAGRTTMEKETLSLLITERQALRRGLFYFEAVPAGTIAPGGMCMRSFDRRAPTV